MGKSKNQHIFLKLVERFARVKVEEDSYRWPPACLGILHQPKRPGSTS